MSSLFADVRPPASWTNKLKRVRLHDYGHADRNPKHYEEDHLLALAIGGAPQDERNLWPEPRLSEWNADKKDQLEFVLYKLVCANKISLAKAQDPMRRRWIAAWKTYVPSHAKYRFQRVD